MKILLESNKITIGEFNSQLSNVSFFTSENRDSVTFQFFSGFEKTIRVSETKVNGVQMTSDNIDQLLSPIFAARAANDSSGENSASPQVYTQVQWSDPLVFPEATRSGHIVEFYKDNLLQEAYQYNGFFWDLLSLRPNLVYTLATGSSPSNTQNDSGVLYAKLNDGNQYIAVKQNAELNIPIETSQFLLYDKSYQLQNVSYHLEDDQQQVNIENLRASMFNFVSQKYSQNNILDSDVVLNNNLLGRFNSQVGINKLTLSNCKSIIEGESINYMYFTAANAFVDSCDVTNISISLVKPQTESGSISAIITNNKSVNGLEIAGFYLEDNPIYSIPLIIKDNQGLVFLNITQLAYLGTIDNAQFDFDETTLESITLAEIYISDSAIEALIKALTEKTFTKPNRTISSYGVAISSKQKARLTSAGWRLDIY